MADGEINMLSGEVTVVGSNYINIELGDVYPGRVSVRFRDIASVPCNHHHNLPRGEHYIDTGHGDGFGDKVWHKIEKLKHPHRYVLSISWHVYETRVIEWECGS